MAFDKELYEGCKQIASNMLHHIPFQYNGTIENWVLGTLSMIDDLNMEENYEGSKAVKDAVVEFINEKLPEGEERIQLSAVINEKYFKAKEV
ncbi:hypothetical protein [Bacteroides reticulotermitis]|uniref:hypothetical protein n=1 Tax=Bacteroides reticulotermitis TaxID=1133319 RepID=UPI003A8BC0C5